MTTRRSGGRKQAWQYHVYNLYATGRRAAWVAGLAVLGGLLLPGNCPGQQMALAQGRITDPQGQPVPRAELTLTGAGNAAVFHARTGAEGEFSMKGVPAGRYTLRVKAPGFAAAGRTIDAHAGETLTLAIQLALAPRLQSVSVVADANEGDALSPDPSLRVLIRSETLDGNPGRPGAPVSIPGLPIETASGGIKAPQYFAPGVAGDHGEPIAQYIGVGTYLVSNNLSANAHGNGYADPNILVPAVIEGVETDGGAFNVREGNHSVNLAGTYALRSQMRSFLTLTGDYRDADIVAGWGAGGEKPFWITGEASFGNGFLDRLEHRKQYKFNVYRAAKIGRHELTFFGIGYYGFSYVPGLVPIGAETLHDTIDPRQKDQTHTALIAMNDDWRLAAKQRLSLSGFFRTYNLTLYSNFGEGLIRQSEFRTVTGGNLTYTAGFGRRLTLLAGVDEQRDAPRRLDLDHYASADPAVYGPFQKVTANDVTINDAAPYVALEGWAARHLRYYLGFRRDEIGFDNSDLLVPAHSFDRWRGVNSPKATLSFEPGEQSPLPFVAISGGEAFFTNDPRIGTGSARGTLVSRTHSYQLVASKRLAGTEVRMTLGHVTTGASLAKIDADTGLQFDEGPGRVRFGTISARRYFGRAMVQASFSKAEARDLSTGEPTPEAPRTILDILGTMDKLPLRLQVRSEYEYVGAKPLGDGFRGVAVKEFRAAILRTFADGRIDTGVNMMAASGYTGQTTEVLALEGEPAALERVVGVRLCSYVSASVSYRFGSAGRN